MLIIWEMESPVILWIFIVQKVIKENFQSCSICMEEVSFLGKKEEGHLFCAEMSRKGFLVFSLEYPLAPETLFPQILKDLMTGGEYMVVY